MPVSSVLTGLSDLPMTLRFELQVAMRLPSPFVDLFSAPVLLWASAERHAPAEPHSYQFRWHLFLASRHHRPIFPLPHPISLPGLQVQTLLPILPSMMPMHSEALFYFLLSTLQMKLKKKLKKKKLKKKK